MKSSYDVLIAGGGVVGCAIARELSKYRISAALAEREADVSLGIRELTTSRARCGQNWRCAAIQ